ncbi:MAG: hypothetical protein ABJF65_00220 [Reichenbachiella sp.]|uniref:hypothetical protein n=1 Tax=Reichenbachiella sp. TaxID=2184521 RepID=UPI00326575B2
MKNPYKKLEPSNKNPSTDEIFENLASHIVDDFAPALLKRMDEKKSELKASKKSN